MRMKNPFDDEPGDEEKGAGETDASETRESDAPEQASDSPEVTESRADDEPEAEADADQGDQGDSDDDGGSDGGKKKGRGEASMTAAPSIGPNTVIDRKPPEERLDFDKISDTDAVGKDKRREVVGGTYGPTRTRVIGTFVAFIAVVAALCVGFYFLAQELDQPPSENPDVAPWSAAEAPQTPPKPLQ